jgi:hypothetical protein
MDKLCNYCGESLMLSFSDGESSAYGLVDAKVSGGYLSNHLCDLSIYRFSICEKCLRKLFGEFAIKPQVSEYNLGTEEEAFTYEQDLASRKYTDWVNNKAAQKAKLATGLCNATEECTGQPIWYHFLSGEFCGEVVCDEHKKGYSNSTYLNEEDAQKLINKQKMEQALE